MPDRLEIVVTLKDIASRAFSKISGAARRFASNVTGAVKSAGRSLLDFAKNIFFVTAAIDALSRAGRALFDLFITGAGTAAKLEARLKAVTGSSADAARIMGFLDQVALQTGASFESLGEAAVLVATMAKDASGAFDIEKFERLNEMLQAMAAFTGPRVPIERLARGLAQFVTTGNVTSLEMFLDVLLGTKKAAEDVTDIPEEIGKAATFITLAAGDAAKGAAGDLDWLAAQLDRLGIGIGLVQDVAELSGIERFNETLQAIARTVGEPLFEALNEGLSEVYDWLQEYPDLIDEFATALGKVGAEGIENVFEALMKLVTSGQLEKFIESLTELLDKLMAGDIEGAFEVMGLGDLGDDLKGAVASLGDIAKALGVVADWILVISGQKPVAEAAGEGFEQIGGTGKTVADVGKDVAAKFERDFDTMVAPLTDWIEDLATRILTPLSLAAAEPQKVQVEITLDNALLDAQIVQGSEETTVRAFDEVHRNYRRQNR